VEGFQMRRLAFQVAAGAAALIFVDYIAVVNSAAVSGISTISQSEAVNRSVKGDRQDRGGGSVQLKVTPSPQITPAPAGSDMPQPKRETKMLEGCELAISPLAESTTAGSPARCLS
jgi:hypothetical protein